MSELKETQYHKKRKSHRRHNDKSLSHSPKRRYKENRSKKHRSCSPSPGLDRLGCDIETTIRLIADLLQIEISIGVELLSLFSRLNKGEEVTVDGVDDPKIRKKLRHLLVAIGMKCINISPTGGKTTVKRYKLPQGFVGNIKKGFRILLKEAAKLLDLSWKDVKHAEPVSSTVDSNHIGSITHINNLLKDVIIVDETQKQLSLMELYQEGLFKNTSQPISQLGSASEPWGCSRMEQHLNTSSSSSWIPKHSVTDSNKQDVTQSSSDYIEEGQPWRRFDREKEFQLTGSRRPVTQSQFQSLIDPNRNLSSRFHKEHRKKR